MEYSWLGYLRRLLLGRERWSAEREFRYYAVNGRVIEEHAHRQMAHAMQDFEFGVRLAESLGVSDLGVLRDAVVLDIGSGDAILAQAMAYRLGASRVVATDAVPKQLWAAGALKKDDRLQCVISDASDMPFGDGSFDVVTCHLVLHHIEPLLPVLQEVRRVLRAGGRLFVMEPSPIAGMLRHEQLSENEAPVPLKSLVQACQSAGLEVLETDYWWARYRTHLLGPLSPNYRVRAAVPGLPSSARLTTLRSLEPMQVPGLLLDAGCQFAELAKVQADQICAAWPSELKARGVLPLG